MKPLPQKIFLAGMMGSGKSAVGRALAKRLAYKFVDTDSLIEKRAGVSINKIFAQQGEAGFRRLERKVIQELCADQEHHRVVALGGGAVASSANLKHLQNSGQLICLTASPATLAKRLRKTQDRPLLLKEKAREKDPEDILRQLLEKRKPYYEAIRWQLSTEGKSEVQIAKEISQQLPLESSALWVKLGERSYPLYFQEQKQAHSLFPEILKRHCPSDKVVVVTNTTLAKLHGRAFLKELRKTFQVETCVLPDGERYKTLKTIEKIYSSLVKAKADRKTPVVALGGGVIGDMAGYAAATFLRGIPFVQVPTTLLAQVDSSIGGKTGVDLPQGKNLIGAFYQPKLVWIEESFLQTLPERQLRCGVAEVIKYGAIFDEKLFSKLEQEIDKLLQGKGNWEPIVRRCCELKAWVVEEDEFETKGLRSQLNFGHSLGHAIESLTNYRKYTHGEAIAMGMNFAAHLSVKKTHLSGRALQRLQELLQRAGLPWEWPCSQPQFSRAKYRAALTQDKKRVSDRLNFVYLKRMGQAVALSTPLEEIVQWL